MKSSNTKPSSITALTRAIGKAFRSLTTLSYQTSRKRKSTTDDEYRHAFTNVEVCDLPAGEA